MMFNDIDDVTRRLQASSYIPSLKIATVVFLATATENRGYYERQLKRFQKGAWDIDE